MGVGHHLVDRFVNKLKPIIEKEKVKDFKLFTSIDIWGEDVEYLRTGLDLQLFEKNLHKYLTGIENSRMSLMITFNILCVVNFRSLLEKILEWRKNIIILNCLKRSMRVIWYREFSSIRRI